MAKRRKKVGKKVINIGPSTQEGQQTRARQKLKNAQPVPPEEDTSIVAGSRVMPTPEGVPDGLSRDEIMGRGYSEFVITVKVPAGAARPVHPMDVTVEYDGKPLNGLSGFEISLANPYVKLEVMDPAAFQASINRAGIMWSRNLYFTQLLVNSSHGHPYIECPHCEERMSQIDDRINEIRQVDADTLSAEEQEEVGAEIKELLAERELCEKHGKRSIEWGWQCTNPTCRAASPELRAKYLMSLRQQQEGNDDGQDSGSQEPDGGGSPDGDPTPDCDECPGDGGNGETASIEDEGEGEPDVSPEPVDGTDDTVFSTSEGEQDTPAPDRQRCMSWEQ